MVGCAVKLGDGPFEPLILLAIAGSVPKILKRSMVMKSVIGCAWVLCSLSLFGWTSVSELESEAANALSTPANLCQHGFSNNLSCAILSTNKLMRIDAELLRSIVAYQRFLNTADGRLLDDQRQSISNAVDLTCGATNSWQYWVGRFLLISTYAADNDFGTAYLMSTNHIRMLQDCGGLQGTNILCNAILSYYEMPNVNIDVAFKVFAGMSSAGQGMGAEATNYANQVAAPYNGMILDFLR